MFCIVIVDEVCLCLCRPYWMQFEKSLKSLISIYDTILMILISEKMHKKNHSLLNLFEFWTFDAIQCRIRFCFQTYLNKRVADELSRRRNAGQEHWIYAWNFYVLHSFDIIRSDADDVQTGPTSIMWQSNSTYRSEKDVDLIEIDRL